MVEIKLSVRGLNDVRKITREAPKKLQQTIETTLSELADDIYNTTTGLAPVDTGYLVKSISVRKLQTKITATASADYASFVDEGTSRMSAQPFFTQPIQDTTREFQSKIENKLKQGGIFR